VDPDTVASLMNFLKSAEPNPRQTDEDDLMPYPVLERIERLAIRDKVAPEGIYDPGISH
jgi:hypothetical protein